MLGGPFLEGPVRKLNQLGNVFIKGHCRRWRGTHAPWIEPQRVGDGAISSSCELILRTLVIDDHLLRLEGTFFRRSNRSRGGSDSRALPIGAVVDRA